jgi:hypothetical protein
MDIVLKNVKKKDLPVFKSLAKSLGFEIAEKVEKPYNLEFVKEILEAEKSIEEGRGVKINLEDLWK